MCRQCHTIIICNMKSLPCSKLKILNKNKNKNHLFWNNTFNNINNILSSTNLILVIYFCPGRVGGNPRDFQSLPTQMALR